ncbi:MAG: hypothetical protein ACK4HD_07380 [Pannonibacter phragmitetus]
MSWSRLSPHELEKRRQASIAALKQREREEFGLWYQEQCDRYYWTHGQCCAGCDHWHSDMSLFGECRAAGIVPGAEVMASLGIQSCTAQLAPGFPMTQHDFHCGLFADEFDWSTLDIDYLIRIEAVRDGALTPKPDHVRSASGESE